MRIFLALTFAVTLVQGQNTPHVVGESGTLVESRALVAQHPKQSSAHQSLGLALTDLGDFKGAIEEFQLALPRADAKERPRILHAIGLSYFQLGEFRAAKPSLEAVLQKQTRKIQPEQVQALTLLAKCDLKLDDAGSALSVLVPHASLAEQDTEYARTLGLALVRTGKLHDGAQMLHRVAELTNDAELYLVAGDVSLENSEFEQARRDLEVAKKLDSRMSGVDTLLGVARLAATDLVAAESSLRDAVRAESNAFLPRFSLAVVMLARGDGANAQATFARTRDLAVSIPRALEANEVTPNLAAQLEPAISVLRRLSEKSQASTSDLSAEAHHELAAVYARLGRSVDAAAEQQLAAEMRY